jgi:hypothetical protein
MTQEQIHASLDKMLENPKAKNFLNHLVRSYLPINKVEKVWDKPTGDFNCALTRESLISVQEILEGLKTEEFKENLMKQMKSMFDENPEKRTAMDELVGDKKLGVTGKDTTTYMGYLTFQAFYDWVIAKSLKGDKHINWLLGSIRRESFVKRAENINDSGVQAKVKKIEKQKNNTATFTLGEANDVLAKIKAKMLKEGK